MESLVICPACRRRFNLKSREPTVLFCCGATACRECVDMMIPKEAASQISMNLYQSTDQAFHCRFCKSEKFCGSKPNAYAKEFLEKEQQGILINCDCEEKLNAELFCKRHQQLLCQGCVIKDHKDHIAECKPLDRGMLEDYMQNVIQYLHKEKEMIQALLETCTKLVERDIVLSSKEFFSISKMVQK